MLNASDAVSHAKSRMMVLTTLLRSALDLPRPAQHELERTASLFLSGKTRLSSNCSRKRWMAAQARFGFSASSPPPQASLREELSRSISSSLSQTARPKGPHPSHSQQFPERPDHSCFSHQPQSWRRWFNGTNSRRGHRRPLLTRGGTRPSAKLCRPRPAASARKTWSQATSSHHARVLSGKILNMQNRKRTCTQAMLGDEGQFIEA